MWHLLSLMLLAVTSAYIQASEEADDDLGSLVKNYWRIGVGNERDVSLDRGGPPKLSKELLAEMHAIASNAGCSRVCLIGLSKIKCTPKMHIFLPGRCNTFAPKPATGEGPFAAAAAIPGFSDLTAMEQYKAQVAQCDCSSRCLVGLANIKCSAALKAALPQRCTTFATNIQKEGAVDSIKEYGRK
uniref:Secreted luciferase n=1 Tax=Heterorhabdus tanneri TaxID=507446 RepID=H3JS15_9MAXI|nr:secreted luciferase [Heterorhabdus tanneri]